MNKIEARIHKRFVVLARRRLSERPDDLERVLQLLAGRRGKGLVRRLAAVWGEERRPSFYDAELKILIEDWVAFRGDVTKFRAPVRWTPESLAELKKYKEIYGPTAAAEKFGVSKQLVHAKLPARSPRAK